MLPIYLVFRHQRSGKKIKLRFFEPKSIFLTPWNSSKNTFKLEKLFLTHDLLFFNNLKIDKNLH